MASERFGFELFVDGADAVIRRFKGVGDSAERELGRVDQRAAQLRDIFSGQVGPAFQELGATARRAWDAMAEGQAALDIAHQTEAVIRSTGGAAKVSADDVATLAGRLGRKAAVDNDVVQSGANVLLTFTNIRNEVGEGNAVLDDATAAALDMSAAMGTDMTSAAMLVGKALNDPIKGMAALGRAGVQFSDEQKLAIRTMVETGDTLGAQKIVLQELERQFGGSAEAQASAMDRITVASGNLKESIGQALLPTIDAIEPVVSGAVDAFGKLPAPLQTTLVLAGGLVSVLGPMGRAIEGVRSIGSVLGRGGHEAASGMNAATTATGGFASKLPSVGRALAGIGIAGAVIGVGQLALGFVNAGKSAEELAGAMTRLNDGEALDQFWTSNPLFSSGTEGHLMTVRQQFEGIAEANIGLAERLRDTAAASGEADVVLAEMDGILASVAEGNAQAARDAQANADATNVATEATEGQADAAEILNEDLRTTADRLDQVRARNEEAADSYTELTDATLGQFDAEARLRGAMRETQSAIEDYAAATDDASTSVNEVDAALDNADQAVRDMAQAALDASGKVAGSAEGNQVLIDSLQRVADNLAEGNPLRTRLEGYIAQLRAVPTSVSTTFEQVYRAPSRSVPAGQKPVERRAKGGPISAGEPYVVGEDGPEVIDPDGSGFVIPNGSGSSRSGAAAAGDTFVQQVFIDMTGSSEAAVSRASLILPGEMERAAKAAIRARG